MALQRISLSIDEIEPGMTTGDFINAYSEDGLKVISIKPNTVLSQTSIERLKRHNVKEVKVVFELPSSRYGEDGIEIDAPPIKPMIDEGLKEEAVESIRSLFDIIGEGGNMTTAYQAVKELDNVVEQLVDTISSESNSFVHIADLKSYDEYTYHHSLSVAILAIAIGQEMGFDAIQLKKLGQCAIMHDIGKTDVPSELINKPGRLTEEEFEIVKEHAERGGKYLRDVAIGDKDLWNIVSHHHEKIDGSGYPKGLKGNQIPLFSQIIAVADVYDAVTSFRAYRSPMSPADAIELVMSEVGRSFVYDIVKAFVEKLEPYPVNTVVELTDKRLGVVIESTNSMRPILQMIDDDSTLDLMAMDNLHLIIERVLEPIEA